MDHFFLATELTLSGISYKWIATLKIHVILTNELYASSFFTISVQFIKTVEWNDDLYKGGESFPF